VKEAILWLAFGYFMGSIPFSYIIPRVRGVDVRKVGSGNVGGTNALRAVGFPWGVLAMIADAAKAFIPVIICLHLTHNVWLATLVATVAVLGHDFPVWLKFKGGKGVGTTVGSYFALYPPGGFIFLGIWLVLTLTTKIVSLSSLIALLTTALILFLMKNVEVGIWGIAMFVLSTFMHRDNIKRLVRREERKTDLLEYVQRGLAKR